MYGCESQTVKKAEHRKINAFELWCWRRLLRVPWTARRSQQSILKELSPGCSLEGLMLKLNLQYFGHIMQRVDSLEKTLILGGIGGRRRRGWQRMRWLDGITNSMGMSLSNSGSWWWTWRPGTLRFMWSQESDTTEQLNWLRDSALNLPLSLFLTIGFLTSLEEFSYLAVLSHHDRWKYFKEYLQTKYSCIVHKHLISLWMYKKNSPL